MTAAGLYAHELGLVPITAPAYSPQSNGLAEAFVKTFERDYVDGAEYGILESALPQLSGWIEDYTTRAPTRRTGCRAAFDHQLDKPEPRTKPPIGFGSLFLRAGDAG